MIILTAKDKWKLFTKSPTGILGAVFTLFGLVFMIPFVLLMDFGAIDYWINDYKIIDGTITEVKTTNSTVNDRVVREFIFEYSIDQQQYSGKSLSHKTYYNIGQAVTLEYIVSKPENARIKDTYGGIFPIWILPFLLIFPLTGMLMLFFSLRNYFEKLRVFKRSEPMLATIKSVVPTNTKVNNKILYQVDFTFETMGKTYEETTGTFKPSLYRNGAQIPILYNQDQPEDALLVEELPEDIKQKVKEHLILNIS